MLVITDPEATPVPATPIPTLRPFRLATSIVFVLEPAVLEVLVVVN